jgi:hypothetical protein
MMGLGFNLQAIAALGVAGLLAVGGAYVKGRMDGSALAEARCQQQVLARDEAVREANRRWQESIDELLQDRLTAVEKRNATEDELRKRTDDYEAELQKRSECLLTDDDVKRLR